MYSNCYHCTADLGRNEAIEAFTTGTRLAFDPARGRLWVVCRKCARWNLSPLDTRWEAMEEAERRYRDSRLRVSTEHIGLARLREGLDLIRIGEPQRPEMAAWRYGDQFGRRRNRQLLITGAVVGGAATVVGGLALKVGFTVVVSVFGKWWVWDNLLNGRQTALVGRIPLDDGSLVTVQRKHARMSSLENTGDPGEFALRLESKEGSYILTDDDARAAAARILPTVNRYGGSQKTVRQAVGVLEECGDPARVLTTLQEHYGRREDDQLWCEAPALERIRVMDLPGALHTLDVEDRLALEMALHEEAERRVMNGELEQLERAWREAETIAAISDDMLTPDSVESRLAGLRLVRNDNGDYSVVAVHSDDH